MLKFKYPCIVLEIDVNGYQLELHLSEIGHITVSKGSLDDLDNAEYMCYEWAKCLFISGHKIDRFGRFYTLFNPT